MVHIDLVALFDTCGPWYTRRSCDWSIFPGHHGFHLDSIQEVLLDLLVCCFQLRFFQVLPCTSHWDFHPSCDRWCHCSGNFPKRQHCAVQWEHDDPCEGSKKFIPELELQGQTTTTRMFNDIRTYSTYTALQAWRKGLQWLGLGFWTNSTLWYCTHMYLRVLTAYS